MKSCDYCDAALRDDKARFEVRTAPDRAEPHWQAGTYCSAFCWDAHCAQKTVHAAIKTLHLDAETVLGDEGQLLRRQNHV